MPELQEDLQALAERRAAESTGDFDSVLVAAKTRKRRRTAGLTVIGAAAVVAAVAIVPTLRPAATDAPVADSPVAPNAAHPPEVKTLPSEQALPKAGPLTLTMVRTLSSATGGQFVASFPDKVVRTATFSLAPAADPNGPLYTLVAKIPGDPTTPYAIRITGEMGIAIPPYSGPGPYTLAVPKGLPAGAYQVCTLSGARLCGQLTVK